MRAVLRLNHPRYEVTDQHTHLLVRRLSDAELHAAADQAAARVTPHLAALTTNTPPPAPAETIETARILYDAVLRAARETASDDPDDYAFQVEDLAPTTSSPTSRRHPCPRT